MPVCAGGPRGFTHSCPVWAESNVEGRQIVKEIGVVSAGEFRSKNLLQDVHAAFLGMETSSPELQPLSALTGP